MSTDITPSAVVAFWKEAGPGKWFARDDAFDAEFRDRFMDAHLAERPKLARWFDICGQRPGVQRGMAMYFVVLAFVPLLGSFITEPAAITLAQRYNLDSRDSGKAQRMAQLNSNNGAWGCTFVGFCSDVCPKQLDPAAAVNQAKVESAKDFIISMFKP